MAKRFTDSDKWKKDWFTNLSKEGKLLWIYITDSCDHAGICDFSEKIFSAFLDFKVTREKIDEQLKNKIIWIEDCKFMIPSFIEFQYGELNPENRVHKSVLDRINRFKEAPYKPLISPLQGAKDKDKDKDMDINKDIIEEVKELTWRDSLEVYQKQSSDAWDALMANPEWIKERKRYHPSLDIRLSMEKAYNDFWGTEAGWKHKKAKKSKEIDWDATFKNALSLKANQVYVQKIN